MLKNRQKYATFTTIKASNGLKRSDKTQKLRQNGKIKEKSHMKEKIIKK